MQIRQADEANSRSEGLACAYGSRVARFAYSDLPPAAIRWAKVGILDTIGVALAGAREPCAALLEQVLGAQSGACVVFGSPRKAAALDAALINGAAAHALDFDDSSNTLGGHPSVPILPALFALADESGATGREFVTAYVAGFEVETKLAMSVHFHHYTKGWHPTATLGVFGAAAACSRLLGLDAGHTAIALALAASAAAGIKANFGTMAKPLHVGRCAREGLLAARLAQAGYTANSAGVFEHEQGFFEVYNGAGTYDAARGLDAWADPLDIIRPGLAIKQYPCCGSTHPAIDAAIEIALAHRPALDAIERVDVWVHARRLKHTDRPAPRSELDAKFSLQYVTARALAAACITLEHFENGAYLDAGIARLLSRVHVAAYGDDRFSPDNHFGGEVRVTLHDGRVLAAKVAQAVGRTSANPLPDDRLHAKFKSCAARALDLAAIDAAYAALQRIETLADMRDLTRHLVGTIARPVPDPQRSLSPDS
ncbi:MAG: MmgE/PrpD family protein [Betaproteobacteria bacterium]|nr:MmgE/PrpD family protein [Betaproteobacteria bacterium]